MSEAIQTYNSMAEFYAAMGGKLKQDADFTIHRMEDVHDSIPFKSPIFRVNYYTIVIIREGRGQYIFDGQTYPTKERTIYFSNPGHLKGFEIYELSSGFIVTFSASFLKKYVNDSAFNEFPFLIAEIVPPHYPEPSIFQEFQDLGEHLLREYESKSLYKFKIIGNLTAILLLKIKERFWNSYNPLAETQASSAIVSNFKQHLEAHFRDLLDGQCDRLFHVQDYAQAQHLNPNYFSTVIKKKTGRSVNSWITERIISDAQAMLVRSPASIQEIASRLGFKNAAHFSSFFKKYTRQSPSTFRQNTQKTASNPTQS